MLKQFVMGLAVAGALSSTAFTSTAFAQEPKAGGVVNAVIQPEPPGLMMGIVQNGPTQMVSGNIYEGLLRYSPKLEPLPGLAESWSVSEDGKVYSFKLRKGVTWHDGKPFTSADVVVLDRIPQADPSPRRATTWSRSTRSRRPTTPPSCSR